MVGKKAFEKRTFEKGVRNKFVKKNGGISDGKNS